MNRFSLCATAAAVVAGITSLFFHPVSAEPIAAQTRATATNVSVIPHEPVVHVDVRPPESLQRCFAGCEQEDEHIAVRAFVADPGSSPY